MSLADRLPSLSHRNFRNLLIGSFVSNIGGQMQGMAIFWHIYHITHKSTDVGLAGLVRVGPLLLFGLFGGFLADQFDRRSVLLSSQVVMTAVAAWLAWVTDRGQATTLTIYLAVALNATFGAISAPARQAMVPSLVPVDHFPNAASVNGIQWRFSEVLGPALAGLMIGSFRSDPMHGLAICYWLNAISYAAVIWATWLLPRNLIQTGPKAATPSAVIENIREGFAFIKGAPVLRNAMFIDFWATFLAGASALLPAFAASILKVDARGYGILTASPGVGAMVASIVLAWSPTIRKQGAWVIGMIGFYGLFTVLFGLSWNLYSAGIFLAATGAADMISTVLRQTIRQLATPEGMRGRMSSISMLFHMTGPQLGDFEAGWLGDRTSIQFSIVIGGIGSLAVSSWYWLRGSALRSYLHWDAKS